MLNFMGFVGVTGILLAYWRWNRYADRLEAAMWEEQKQAFFRVQEK